VLSLLCVGAGASCEADDEDASRPNQASALVAFVADHADLFHDRNKVVYAYDRTTRETRRIEGRQFRDWLMASFYERTRSAPRDQSIREALGTLAGLGRSRGACNVVNVRVARSEGSYFIDLGEPANGRAVKINPGSWEIVAEPSERFVRPDTMQPLPEPTRGGDIAPLWELVNVPDHARLLVLAFLLECLRPDTPFPVLELIGEQGSAKSTTQRILRTLIDPNQCALRAAPKGAEDLFVSAGATLVVSLENISHLSAPMQDALCVLSTGGGFAKRKLYTDADEMVIDVQRPVMLNGISAAITAQDLVDRTVSVETPVIAERWEVTDLHGHFHALHASLLGALLDLFAAALARLPTVVLDAHERPRLVEFARLGTALAEVMGLPAESFMLQFNASRAETIARTIDASPVATAVMEYFEARSGTSTTLSVKALLNELEGFRPQGAGDMWPRTPKRLGDDLRRSAPSLRQMGIEVRSLGKIGSHVQWRIGPREPKPAPSRASRDVVPDRGGHHDMTTFTTSPGQVSSAWGGL
jgi:hypothetical protein